MKNITGTLHLAKEIEKDFLKYLPEQRSTQRKQLSLLTATMLVEKTANTMELAAALPSQTERLDMRHQWVWRALSNLHIECESIMKAFAKPILESLADKNQILVVIIDQTIAANGHEILMLGIRIGKRALPLFWCIQKTEGNIGFKEQKKVLDHLVSMLPKGLRLVILGDRFYGTSKFIDYCNKHNWDYRVRIKGSLRIQILNENIAVNELATRTQKFFENAFLATSGTSTNIGIIHEQGHPEPWIIAMNSKPDFYKTLDYGMRWSIEAMFSDFKSRGFGLEQTQMQYTDRLSRLILVMALALYYAVSVGIWDSKVNPTPDEKKRSTKKTKKLSTQSVI